MLPTLRALLASARWLPCACWGVLAACESDDPCEQHTAKVESCQRMYTRDVCSEPRDRCVTACFARLSCAELDGVDRGEYPASLTRCLTKCVEPFACDDGTEINARFRCDAAKDCADGSDERGCTYHICENGQPVQQDVDCDGYANCADASDEEDCPGGN